MSKRVNGNVLRFPDAARSRPGFQPVKSSYNVREIKQLFGLSERLIRRWTDEGIIQATSPQGAVDPSYDFRALTQFRRVRELRNQGLSIKKIDAELRGQMCLFKNGEGQIAKFQSRLSPFEEALLLHERGNPEAAACYRGAIRSGDYLADAYCNLGILEFEQGRVIKAFDCFTMSLKHEPRHVEAHFNLANLYFDADELRLARLHYEIVVELEPAFSHPYLNLGLVLALQGNLTEAREKLLVYKTLEPDDETRVADELLMKLESVMICQH
jgi:tetratricopeptide (TPR) repeat protein